VINYQGYYTQHYILIIITNTKNNIFYIAKTKLKHMTEREKRNDNILIGIIIGVVLYSIVLYLLVHVLHLPVR
jgi:hypothetical protein